MSKTIIIRLGLRALAVSSLTATACFAPVPPVAPSPPVSSQREPDRLSATAAGEASSDAGVAAPAPAAPDKVEIRVLRVADEERGLVLGDSALLTALPDSPEVLHGSLLLPPNTGMVVAVSRDAIYQCQRLPPVELDSGVVVARSRWSRHDRATSRLRWAVELPGQCLTSVLLREHLVVGRFAPDALTWLALDDGRVSLDLPQRFPQILAGFEDQLCTTTGEELSCWRGTDLVLERSLAHPPDAMALTPAGVVLSTETGVVLLRDGRREATVTTFSEVGGLCFDGQTLLILDSVGLHGCDANVEHCQLLFDSTAHEIVSAPGLSMRCEPGHVAFEHNPRLHVWETVWVSIPAAAGRHKP